MIIQSLIFTTRNQRFAKVVFLHLSVSHSVQSGWKVGVIPACIAVFQAHTQGEVEGSGWGVSRPTPGGASCGVWPWGGLQAHTQGGSCRVWPGGSPGPHPGNSPGPYWGGLQAHTEGVSRPKLGGGVSRLTPGEGIPTCTEADTPPQLPTAAGGTHPTGMRSYWTFDCLENQP